MTDDPAYGTADLGLVLGSTNEDIWNEEVAKEPGLRALRAVFTCDDPRCSLTPREHLQDTIFDVGHLREAADLLAPHEAETREALLERLMADAARRRAEAGEPDEPEVTGMFLRLGPNGMELVPMSEVPAEVRDALAEQILNDPEVPEEVKARFRESVLGEKPSVH